MKGKLHANHRFGWLSDDVILAGTAALLAFAAVYASVGNAGIFLAVVSGIGVGVLIYAVANRTLRKS